MDIQDRLADRARDKAPSAIRELVKYMKIEGMISLGGGYPNPDTFAFERVKIAFKDGKQIEIDGDELSSASQYGPSDAHANLKQEIQQWHKFKDDVDLQDNQLVVLNGSQEGLFIMAYLLANQDDRIVISEPIYPGTLSAFQSFTRNFIAAPLDAQGMQTENLEQQLETIEMTGEVLPKFIYANPTGHNPGGVTMSLGRRKHLLDIAERYDLFILEDDPYQLLKLDKSPQLPTLQSMDKTGKRVVRLDSFSKIFAPGLRLGYVSGPADLMRQFVLFKQSANLHTSTFIQVILLRYLKAAGYDKFMALIKKNCESYRINRDAMVAAAKKHLIPEVKFNLPNAGMFIWFELPRSCNCKRMIEEQSEELKVLLVPGDAFSSQNGLKNFMRASFSLVSPEEIDEGMRRFGAMIKNELHR